MNKHYKLSLLTQGLLSLLLIAIPFKAKAEDSFSRNMVEMVQKTVKQQYELSLSKLIPIKSRYRSETNLFFDLTCNNVTNGGEISGNKVDCGNFNPSNIANESLPSGGSGNLEYLWLKTTDPELNLSQWDVIPGADNASYNPGSISGTTYYIRCSRREGCTAWDGESNVIYKIVNPIDPCDPGETAMEQSGNAIAVTSSSGVIDASFSLGTPDGQFAQLYDENDALVLDLGQTIPTGAKYTVIWKYRNYDSSFSGPSKLNVSESSDGSNFDYNTQITTTVKTFFVATTITASTSFRYLKLRLPKDVPDAQVDAVYYCFNICDSNPPTDPPTSWNFPCDNPEGVQVDLYGKGINGQTSFTLNIPSPSNVSSIIVEATSKGGTPVSSVVLSTPNESVNAAAQTVAEAPNGASCNSCRVYRAQFNAAGSVSINTNGATNIWSIVAYVIRNGVTNNNSYSANLETTYIFHGDDTFTLPISTSTANRTITVTIPVVELSNDSRIIRATATAGGVSETVEANVWDPALMESLRFLTLTLNNVPGSASSLVVDIESPDSNGDSFLVNGVTASADNCSGPVESDYGDTPPTYGSICYTITDDGNPFSPTRLGNSVDGDPGMQNSNMADGDDNDGNDDEDGVSFDTGTTLEPGTTASITINWSTNDNDSYIFGWIDYDGNGMFDDPTERVIDGFTVGSNPGNQGPSAGSHTFDINVPSMAACGTTYARFTIQSDANEGGPTGDFCNGGDPLMDGEVEDYKLLIGSDNLDVTITSLFGNICNGESTTLIAAGSGGQQPYTFQWDNGLGSGPVKDVSPTTTTTYSVTITDGNGCMDNADITVEVYPNPIVSLECSESNNAASYSIINVSCNGNNARTFYAGNGFANNYGGGSLWSAEPGATFIEKLDNTATLIMSVRNLDNPDLILNFNVTFTGKTSTPPPGSPKTDTQCNVTLDPSDWIYYTAFSGTATGDGDLLGAELDLSNTGASYQQGLGAALTTPEDVLGASSWIAYTILSQPNLAGSEGDLESGVQMDFNFGLMDSPSDCTVCAGESATLTASGTGGTPPYSFSWSHGLGSGPSQTVSPLISTNYTVTLTDDNGCESVADITVNVSGGPDANAGNDVSICEGESTTLMASASGGTPPYTFSWSHGLGNGPSKTVSPSSTTTYSVTVTDAEGCLDIDEVIVIVTPGPTVEVDGGTICAGESFTLNANASGGIPPYTFSWSHGLGGGNSVTVSPATTTTYTVTVTDVNGCMDTNMATVIVDGGGDPGEISGDEANCGAYDADEITSVDPGSGGPDCGMTSSENCCVDGGGNKPKKITMRYTGEDCSATSTTQSGGSWSCSGDPASDNSVYILATDKDPNDSNVSIWFSGTVSLNGSYMIDAANANASRLKGNTWITIYDSQGGTVLQQVNFHTSCSQPLAVGDQFGANRIQNIQLENGDECVTTNTGLDYQWQSRVGNNGPWSDIPGATGEAFDPGIITETTQFRRLLVCNSLCDEVASNIVTKTVYPEVEVSLGPDQTVCEGESVTLSATGSDGTPPYIFSWNQGLGSGPSHTVSPNSTTTYRVTITDANGCADTDEVTVHVNPNPEASIACDNGNGGGGSCQNTTTYTAVIDLTGNVAEGDCESNGLCGGQDFSSTVFNNWTDVMNFSDPIPNGSSENIVEVRVTLTMAACDLGSSTSQSNVDQEDIDYTIELNGVVIGTVDPVEKTCTCIQNCDVQTITKTFATGLGTYNFGGTNNIDVNFNSHSPNFNQHICVPEIIVELVVCSDPPPADCTICEGETATLTASGSGGTGPYTFNWSNGLGSGATQIVSPNVTTTYTVTVTDSNGCDDTEVITVTVNPNPDVDAGPDVDLCEGESTTLTANISSGTPPYSIEWSTGETTSSIIVSPTQNTTYSVTVTDANGCMDIDEVTVFISENLEVTVNDEEICEGESATLTAMPSGTAPFTFLWETGEDTPSITVSPNSTTTYQVTVTDANGCTGVGEGTVTVHPNPSVSISVDAQETCEENNGALTANPSGGTPPYTYLWSNDETTQSISGLPAGTYSVTITDANGCQAEASATIEERCFDLALRKVLSSSTPGPFAPGSTVTFDIEVINQGSIEATIVEVTDYIPNGFTLMDPSWTQSGNLATQTIAGPIAPGNTETISITFTIDNNFQGTEIVNYAEVSDSENPFNQPDEDSPEDQDNTNDAGGQPMSPADDFVDGDGTGTPGDGSPATDEDNHDPEKIVVGQRFDLALRKTTISSGPYAPGSAVTFQIEVINQGSLEATNVEITDYIPAGLSLADANWSQSGNLATQTISGPIAANGGTTTVTINFTIDTDFQGNSIVNYAEISDADNPLNQPDEDSTPDQDNTNDAGGQPMSPADDAVDGDGTGTPGDGNPATDEDDHDPAKIDVDQVFDLALRKTTISSGPYSQGSTVTFQIEVINQGSLEATNVEITDYIPAGLTLADANWAQSGNLATQTIAGPIAANGGTTTVTINFTIDNDFQGTSIVNYAEISDAENALNQPDEDSTPDQDNTNDAGGQPDSPADDAVNGDGTGTPGDDNPATDEDDHDPAKITVDQVADIDIEKSTNGFDADLPPGPILLIPNEAPPVEWEYVVTNTGTLDLIDVVVTDDQEGVICTIPFLAAGASTSCDLTGVAMRGMYMNLSTVEGQPVDENGDPAGDPVTDEDPSNYTGVFINVEKNADPLEICEGEEVTYTLTVRMLGGAPGVQFRDIMVEDNNLPDILTVNHPFFVGGDLNNNGYLDFIDNNNDGISDEEFLFEYTLTLDQTTTNIAMDMADVYFVDPNGNETFIGSVSNMDEVTVTVNPNPDVTISIDQQISCAGNDGEITANASGGMPPYTYNWETGETTATISNLTPGTYRVTVTDSKGCMESQEITINQNCNFNLTKNVTDLEVLGAIDFRVVYTITVENSSSVAFDYDLDDTQFFDDDVEITAVSYTTDAPGNPQSPLAGSGPYNLAEDQPIAANTTHTYTITFDITVDLNDGSGDNNLSSCPDPASTCTNNNQALLNKVELDVNDDNVADEEACDCTLPPLMELNKTVSSLNSVGPNQYEVSYDIAVSNLSPGAGEYDLEDTPFFDGDVTINSASFTTDAPGVTGGALAGSGPYLLATDVAIAGNATHNYTIIFNVTVNVTDGIDDDFFSDCPTNFNTASPPNEGLLNRARLEVNGDNQFDLEDFDCTFPSPELELTKTVNNLISTGPNQYEVSYDIVVSNLTPVAGEYDLDDTPFFDGDVTINSAFFTTDAPGITGGPLAGSGPYLLAVDEAIAGNATLNYTITFNVTVNVTDGIDDDFFSDCPTNFNMANPPNEGLLNRARLEVNGDNQFDLQDFDCIVPEPELELTKTVNALNNTGPNQYEVSYDIVVSNTSPVAGEYDLEDTPFFDGDVTINSASFTTDAPGVTGGPLAGSGPYLLAVDESIAGNTMHNYTITFQVTVNVTDGIDDDFFSDCPDSFNASNPPNEGLLNRARLEVDGDNQFDLEDFDCIFPDPELELDKTVSSLTTLGNNQFQISYDVTVENLSPVDTDYDLDDMPMFDDDVVINSVSYSSDAPGNPGGPLVGTGPYNLAEDQDIAGNALHTYTISFIVTIDLEDAVADNILSDCPANPDVISTQNQGLLNEARLDVDDDDIIDQRAQACDIPPILRLDKTVTSLTALGANQFSISYDIEVENLTSVATDYDLDDMPMFDDDVVINSISYTSNAPGNAGGPLAGNGPYNLAEDQAISGNANHIYTLTFVVTIDLNDATGDNLLSECPPNSDVISTENQGLLNEALLDVNDDDEVDLRAQDCDLPPILTLKKEVLSLTANGPIDFEISYEVTVENQSPAPGEYDLKDNPFFDDDVTINSAFFTSNVPGNGGNPLVGDGPYTLATDQTIFGGSVHTYILTFNVTIDLQDGQGDDMLAPCPDPVPMMKPDAAMLNCARLEATGDGVFDLEDCDCDLPPIIVLEKVAGSATATGTNQFDVTFDISVENLSPIPGEYDLNDIPYFDTDAIILGASYTSDAPGNAGGVLAVSSPYVLAVDQTISGNTVHTYTITFSVEIDLGDNIGDNVMTDCPSGDLIPPQNQGFLNEAQLEVTGDDVFDLEDQDCVPPPPIFDLDKAAVQVDELNDGTFNAIYEVQVFNLGASAGTYNLFDQPDFDDDVTILGASYTSDAPGNPVGNLFGNGPWTLASDQTIGAGAVHTYTLVVNIDMQLQDGQGDDLVSQCMGEDPGVPGNALFNEALLDIDDDGGADFVNDACLPLPPKVILEKVAVNIQDGPNGTFDASYSIVVSNIGGSADEYNLFDAPMFDDDVAINSASFTSDVPGIPGAALPGAGPWPLAVGQTIVAGAVHTFDITFNVSIILDDALGDNVMTSCQGPGTGLFNEAQVDLDNDGQPELTDDDCLVTPVLELDKTFISAVRTGAIDFDVTYTVAVSNVGEVDDDYDLTDMPMFDNDIFINGASYTSNAPGNAGGGLAGNGPWTLANDQNIDPGEVHTYTIVVQVSMDLTDGQGDDIYHNCQTLSNFKALNNEARLDTNNDGEPDQTDRDCGELPQTQVEKEGIAVLPQNDGTYNVVYNIIVSSIGGTDDEYDLLDIPSFDDDVIINSASYSSDAPGNPGGALAGSGPWMLANDQFISLGGIHTYNLVINVSVNVEDGIGNDEFINCIEASSTPQNNIGLYNIAELDVNDDGIADDEDDACLTIDCDINASFTVECFDNNTPQDPSDDQFFVHITVNGLSTGSGWTTVNDPNGPTIGDYNVEITLGPYAIADGPILLVIQDLDDPNCLTLADVNPPEEPCSEECNIEAFAETFCDDNGTPGDPSDDIFTVEITVNGSNTPSDSWVAILNGEVLGSQLYNRTLEVDETYPIENGGFTVIIQDSEFPDLCMTEVMVTPPDEPCSEECTLDVELVTDPVCDNNGTPFDPNDDIYFVTLVVNGFNAGDNGWFASNGAAGEFGEEVTFGPFNIADGSFLLTFAAVDDILCTETIEIIPPECPPVPCELFADIVTICDNNNTPGDDSDDTFTVELTVTGVGTGASGWSGTVNGAAVIGSYGIPVVFGPFPIAGGNIAIELTDNEVHDCTLSEVAEAPSSCSEQCVISANVTGSPICNDNGTPQDPSDDFFTFFAQVNSINNTSSGWVASNGQTGSYGVSVQLGPFQANGQVVSIGFADSADPNCLTSLEVSSPPCSDACTINANVQFVSCDNNGTPTDPSDDQYLVGVFVGTPYPQNTSGFWTSDDPAMAGNSYPYNSLVVFGPYPIGSTPFVTISFADIGDPSCSASITAQAPPPCPECDIDVESVDNIICDDNGTPTDPGDDTFTFDVTVTGMNVSPLGWRQVFPDGTFGLQGQYGVPTTFGPYPISGGPVSIRIRDRMDSGCRVDFSVDPPFTCSDGTELGDMVWEDENDNGLMDPGEPGIPDVTVRLYTCDGNFLEEMTTDEDGKYLFTGLDPNVDYYLEFTDIPDDFTFVPQDQGDNDEIDSDPDPDTGRTICIDLDPGESDRTWDAGLKRIITPECSIATTINKVCDDNNTPNDLTDDLFTIEITINGTNTGSSGWSAVVGGQMFTGDYGETIIGGPFPIAGGNVSLFVSDNEIAECTASMEVTPTPPCSVPVCQLNASVANVECSDNGTPFDPSDDTFTFELTVGGQNTGNNGWEASDGTTGNYDQSTVFGPYNISDGDIDLDISDADDPDCAISVHVTAPMPCSDGCDITDVDIQTQCMDNGTPFNPSDDIYSVTLTVNGMGVGVAWQAEINGMIEIGLYGVPVVLGPYQISDGPISFTLVDILRPDCTEDATINPPMPCSEATGPEVECPTGNHFCPILEMDIMLFNTDPFDCSATIEVPLPDVTVTCSPEWEVVTEIVDDSGQVIATIGPDDPRIVSDLAIGDYLFRFIVTDGCDLTTVKECPFRIADLRTPIASCVGGVNMTLGDAGLARAFVNNINFGSYDNCGIETIELRRVYTTDPASCDPLDMETYSDWGPYVEFTCCDAGQMVVVEMRVTDIYGNESTCWTEVLVEDKMAPLCVSLEDTSISCDELPSDFDPNNTAQLAELFGMPNVLDNCSAEAFELAPEVNLSSCGSGTIIRNFQAVDASGNESENVVQQTITLSYELGYTIIFPADVLTDCVDEMSTVEIVGGGCEDIVVTYEDEFQTAQGAACYHIERTYHVINWCEYGGIIEPVLISRDEDCDGEEGEEAVYVINRGGTGYIDRDGDEANNNPAAGTKGTSCDGSTNPEGHWRSVSSNGYWTYTRSIRVIDLTAPVIDHTVPPPVCGNEASCTGFIEATFKVEEGCVVDSISSITVMLDANADGQLDGDITAMSLVGEFPDYKISGNFPTGQHILELSVIDGCGNEGRASIPFEVLDCFIADPLCVSGLSFDLEALAPGTDVDGDGEADAAAVAVAAVDLANISAADCSEPIWFSVNREGETPDINQTSIFLTCADLPTVQLEVYIWDSASNPTSVQPDGTVGGPNYKRCSVEVGVQDPQGACQVPNAGGIASLSGLITTEVDDPVEGVDVHLSGPELSEFELTDANGNYLFDSLDLHQNYTITPQLDKNHRNGVTTIDVITIHRHLLGLNTLDTPYKLIAADANNSGSVTTLDIIELRRLVLDDIEFFNNNTSWRFVDAAYGFPIAENPWFEAYPELIAVEDLESSRTGLDFVGVKIGDVNHSAVSSSLVDVEERNFEGRLDFQIEDQYLEPGKTYQVTFTTDDLANIQGYQFTLHFDPDALTWQDVEYAHAKAEHFGWRHVKDGAITMSWHDLTTPISDLEGNQEMFTLVFQAKRKAQLQELLNISSQYTLAEAYDRDQNLLEVNLVFTTSTASLTGFELLQNVPNPFQGSTSIGFKLPEAMEVTFTIHNAAGQIVQEFTDQFEKGYNEWNLQEVKLPNGLLFYTMTTDQFTATRRMMNIGK